MDTEENKAILLMDFNALIGAYKLENTNQNITQVMVLKATFAEIQIKTKICGVLQKILRNNGVGVGH